MCYNSTFFTLIIYDISFTVILQQGQSPDDESTTLLSLIGSAMKYATHMNCLLCKHLWWFLSNENLQQCTQCVQFTPVGNSCCNSNYSRIADAINQKKELPEWVVPLIYPHIKSVSCPVSFTENTNLCL